VANREKRAALSHFQPGGVLVSQGGQRATRRSFNEDVLDSARPAHRLAREFEEKVQEEAAAMLGTSRRFRPLGRRTFEMGMAYVGMVSAHGRRMRGWDAIHLYEACRWAREAGEKVTLATSDKDFGKTIDLFPEFGNFVDILDTTA
jgi:hypothetical protein